MSKNKLLGRAEMMETLRESDNAKLEFITDQELHPRHT